MPYAVQKVIWIVPCENWMFKLLENDFLCFNSFIFYLCYYVDVKKEKNEMNFKFSIGPSHFISEITTHVFRLKRLETWLIKNQMFFNKKSEGTMSYILGVKWFSGCCELGDHEIYQK